MRIYLVWEIGYFDPRHDSHEPAWLLYVASTEAKAREFIEQHPDAPCTLELRWAEMDGDGGALIDRIYREGWQG